MSAAPGSRYLLDTRFVDRTVSSYYILHFCYKMSYVVMGNHSSKTVCLYFLGCKGKADVVFILDSTGSLKEDGHNKEKDFVKQVADK